MVMAIKSQVLAWLVGSSVAVAELNFLKVSLQASAEGVGRRRLSLSLSP